MLLLTTLWWLEPKKKQIQQKFYEPVWTAQKAGLNTYKLDAKKKKGFVYLQIPKIIITNLGLFDCVSWETIRFPTSIFVC